MNGAVFEVKISKVGSPFLIFALSRKISLQQIGENFVPRGFLIGRLLSANDGLKLQVAIHVFVDGRQTQIYVPSLKIYLHFSVAVDAVVRVVNFFDLSEYVRFFQLVFCLALFQEIVEGIGIDTAFFE